jgi:hypothetical protein
MTDIMQPDDGDTMAAHIPLDPSGRLVPNYGGADPLASRMVPSDGRSPAYHEGWAAYHDGKSETANPYDSTTDDCLDWNDGFADAWDDFNEGAQ